MLIMRSVTGGYTMSQYDTNVQSIAVLTSGGDAPGMNPAVRAVVRTAVHRGAKVFAVREGYRGLAEDNFDEAGWDYVSGIIDKGGTLIGTTRYPEFEKEIGKLKAALNMIKRGINRLIVIGGDGSLTGAARFYEEWPQLVAKLAKSKKITAAEAVEFKQLAVVGMVGSIDNDMTNTDYTIGTDTALQRISEAIDAIGSTAASHQRIFVVKVMGRHCGYLALAGALITGADWVLIPESPSRKNDWRNEMIKQLKKGLKSKRATIVILSEGATDKRGNLIGSNEVKEALEEGLKKKDETKADVRVTILGHVQRGGSPSAIDRIQSSRQGSAAVDMILSEQAFASPKIILSCGNKLKFDPLLETIQKNDKINEAIESCDFKTAMDLRGDLYKEIYQVSKVLMKPAITLPVRDEGMPRLAILHSGAPAPGMNAAVRAAARLAIDGGYEMIGIDRGFEGLIQGLTRTLKWDKLNGWASMGGAELGISRTVPSGREFSGIDKTLEKYNIKGLIMVGGWSGYEGILQMMKKREIFDSFDIPMVCIPSTISSNLPGTETAVGADTALNNILDAVDKIKQSAVAAHRCFVVEVSGRFCGYLALMSGLTTGAERVYMHEQNLTLEDLLDDLRRLTHEFRDGGRRVALMIRNQRAYRSYDTNFMTALFNEESQGYFDARQAILGHLQHGGNPSPFDRVLATRLAAESISIMIREIKKKAEGVKEMPGLFLGLQEGGIITTDLNQFYDMVEIDHQRAKKPWWLQLKTIARTLAREPGS
jgi:6-phosphofructokinase 1